MGTEIMVEETKRGKTFVTHPLVFIAKAIRRDSHTLGFRGFRKNFFRKFDQWILRKLEWYSCEELSSGDLAFVKLFDGKKVKITIEVLEK